MVGVVGGACRGCRPGRSLDFLLSMMGREKCWLSTQFWGKSVEGALLVSHYGGRGQPEPKVSPLQLQQPQPRGAGLAAGRLRCGHIWGTAAWPGPERVTWHRQDRPGAYKAKTPWRGSGESAGHVPESPQCRHTCTRAPQPLTATASGARPPRFDTTS